MMLMFIYTLLIMLYVTSSEERVQFERTKTTKIGTRERESILLQWIADATLVMHQNNQ